MLFSHETIADWLNEHFECAWQQLRPAPRIDVDFGGGVTLTRTANGNIATWFCLPDGRAIDVLPGLVEPDEFLRRAKIGHAAVAELGQLADGHELAAAYRLYHAIADTSGVAATHRASNDSLSEGSQGAVARAIQARERVLTEPATLPPSGHATLVEDTTYYRAYREAPTHALLTRHGPRRPFEIATALFAEVLHVDLADPFLGLAPDVLGGGALGRGFEPQEDAGTIDWSATDPVAFLDSLALTDGIEVNGPFAPFVTIWNPPPASWIRLEHIAALMERVESDAPARAVVSSLSSILPTTPSTIGAEARMLVESYRQGRYPAALHAGMLPTTAVDLRPWWRGVRRAAGR